MNAVSHLFPLFLVLTIIPWKIAETLIIAHITQLGRKIKVFAGRKKELLLFLWQQIGKHKKRHGKS